MAIVWAWPSTVEAYAAAGRTVDVPRPACPSCLAAMTFWSGYWRHVRVGVAWQVWVRRARCPSCLVSHALLPSFCLVGRRFGVEVIGPVVDAHVAGVGTRSASRTAGVEQWTVRSWCRRHLERARLAVAVAMALAVVFGAGVALPVAPVESVTLSALDAVVAGSATDDVGRWPTVSLLTRGMWLVPTPPTGSRAFSESFGGRLMAEIDHMTGERPP